MNRLLRVALIGVVAGGLLAACSGDEGGAPTRVGRAPTTTTTSSPGPATTTSAAPVPRVEQVRLETIASVDQPTAIAFTPDGDTAFVAERPGRLRRLSRDGETFALDDRPALDLTDRVESGGTEQGLLGVAVSGDGRWLVVDLIEHGGRAGTSVIERYALDGDRIDPSSRLEVLRVEQPFANHNGGHVVFGPDGMLYVGFGDGGSQDDPRDNGQNTGVLLAKILRLDVRGDEVAIPADNPFTDGAGGARPEIWLYGVRNPWRFSFDRATGDLWIGDVGGAAREEVDHLPAAQGGGRGANLGWQAREGTASGDDELDESGPVIDPVFEYSHDDGCSITGGYLYRGAAIPGLVGDYVFADFCTAELWALDSAGQVRSLGAGTEQLTSFGEDPDGELYVLSLGGDVLRVVP